MFGISGLWRSGGGGGGGKRYGIGKRGGYLQIVRVRSKPARHDAAVFCLALLPPVVRPYYTQAFPKYQRSIVSTVSLFPLPFPFLPAITTYKPTSQQSSTGIQSITAQP